MSFSIKTFEHLLIAAVLFYSGLVFCLPVQPAEDLGTVYVYPWWATRIQFGLIILNEILFIFWLLLFGLKRVSRNILNKLGTPTRQAAICLIFLGIWCGLVSIFSDFSTLTQNTGRTLRLILLAFMLIATVEWAKSLGNFVLVFLVFGILVGTTINLIISLQNPFILWGSMRLHGQNTPGVWMGLAAHMSAWLFALSHNKSTKIFSILTLLVCGFACAFSFSRIGWTLLLFGIISWFVILIFKTDSKSKKNLVLATFICLIPLSIYGPNSQILNIAFDVVNLVKQKSWVGNDSNSERMAYVYGTTEIVLKNPLGVGYSGFYDAMIQTDVYKSGVAAREVKPKEANPHMTFLWYSSTGGVFASFLSILLFFFLARISKISLQRVFGKPGLILFICFIGSMLMIAITVPYLFNSTIFYLPVAIIAGFAKSRLEQGRGSDFLATSGIIPK